ncbi:YOL014W-like protein [Saccharomyces cerevisiae x Saccharomyces kudriavzevii VIN7]|uniref:YOL014W-like protein n=1 Tax=Saccharomyces cerevisiae x Saccharomyces kudriavzevii (strain VIN7) TaxID=1095631 RepID=H0H0W7_SACCK|nr:YOL014W-like protein [Saccharomyces cerevisiae x Saccharomyces kudriavzevii VIN7]
MSNSSLSSASSLPSNGTVVLYCGNMGVMNMSQASACPDMFWACGAGYESALATLTRTSTIIYSANMPTSSKDPNVFDCGYQSTMYATESARSPVDYWNCGRTYARDYALSDALSLKPLIYCSTFYLLYSLSASYYEIYIYIYIYTFLLKEV